MEETPREPVETDQLTEEIIARSLDLNDWLEQIQPGQQKPAVRGIPGGVGQASRTSNSWMAWLLKLIRRTLSLFRRRRWIKVLQVSQFGYAVSQMFWGGWCDSPMPDSAYQGKTLLIQGWVIGKPAPVTALRLVVNRTCIREIPINLMRPDVVEAFKFLPAGEFGFSTVVNLNEFPSEGLLRLDAVFANRQVESLALIQFYRY